MTRICTCLCVCIAAMFCGCAQLKPLWDAMPNEATWPLPGGGEDEQPAEDLPFAWSDVQWVSGDRSVADWAQAITITGANVSSGDTVSWSYAGESLEYIRTWNRTTRIHRDPNACIGWVTQIDGEWYGAIGEWLLPGQFVQSKKLFKSDRGNKRMFAAPLRDFEPKRGQVFYLFVCGLNWSGQANVQERSNLIPVTYH